MERINYDSQTNQSLKSLCLKRKIPVTGNKAVLIARLKQFDEVHEKVEAENDAGGDGDIEVAGNGARGEDPLERVNYDSQNENDAVGDGDSSANDDSDDDDKDGRGVDDTDDKDDEGGSEEEGDDYFSTFVVLDNKKKQKRL